MPSILNNTRILFVLPAFYRNGAVDLVVNLAEELVLLNQNVEIFAINQQELHSRLPEEPVKVTIPLSFHQSPKKNLPQLISQLIKSIRNADVVFLPWENGPALLWPSLIASIFRKPTLAIVQNNIQSSFIDYPSIIAPYILRWAYSRAKAIVCVSKDLKKIVEQELNLNSIKVKSISNGMNLKKIRSAAQQSFPSKVLKNDLPYIVGIGRLALQKGFDLLIEAHATVLKRGIPHRLVLIGEGEERAALSRLCQNLGVTQTVIFLGFIPNPHPVLAQASLFCLSSRYEGLPLSLIEATILGIPTIATDCPTGPQEILVNGLYGDLVETESVEALSNAIEKHFRQPQKLIKKGQASAKEAERLSIRTCTNNYIELINHYLQ